MIPILYESNETSFTSQGIGALAESTSASVSRVLNGKDELVLVYPCTGMRYADLQNDRIIFAQPEYKKSSQPYQIYKITKPLNGLVTVYARHVGTQRAKYIPVAPFEAGSVIQAFNDLPTYLKESNPFTFWTDKNTVANFKMTVPASLGSVLGGMEGSILDVYGGEYEFDGYTIKLWNRRGSDGGVELRYGKNITNIEHNEDFDGIVTGVVPYWEGMDDEVVYLPEIVVEGPYADQYSFRRSVIKDFSEAFEDKPSVADLRSAAQNYIAQTGISLPKVDLSVNFEHLAQYTEYEGIALLEQLNLGDSVSIYYEPLGVSATARIVKTNYDCLTEKYISVQIGSVKNDLAQIMSAQANTAQELKNAISKTLPSAIEEAVEHVTDLITGAEGGYVVLDRDANGKPYQILIMDTDSKNTATNVIRLNQNGIGFSSNGYSGPYTTAWTIDSNFVADFITTGNFNASLAKIGILQDVAGKNSWNMQTGAFTITNGRVNIQTSSETDDIIQFNGSNLNAQGYGSTFSTQMQPLKFMVDGNFYTAASHQFGRAQMKVVDGNPPDSSITLWSGEYSNQNPSEYNYYTQTVIKSDSYRLFSKPPAEQSREILSLNKNGLTLKNSSGVTMAQYLTTGAEFWNGSSTAMTALLRPDSNGAGRLMLGDGTATTWRVELNNTGLTFRNTSNATTVQLRHYVAGCSWYQAREYSAVKVPLQPTSASAYYPVASIKGWGTDWSMGILNNDFYFCNTTDTNYGSGTNSTLKYRLPFYSGVYATYDVLTERTGALKPVHISGSTTTSFSGTTYKYTGVSFTVPADRYFVVTAHAYYSSVNAKAVAISSSSTGLTNGYLQMEGLADYTGTRARCTWSGYLSSQTTYYIWAQAVASGNLGIGVDGFYFA